MDVGIISIGYIASAFAAGLLTFLAPCTLPLVPAYLGFISGVSAKDLESPSSQRKARRKIVQNGLFFIVGFAAVFVLFGSIAGFLGQSLSAYQVAISRVGGVLVVFFGLMMLGVFTVPFLQADKHIRSAGFFQPGKPASSFLIGAIFAFGWTPCVGPILGSILLLAASEATALQGAFLLLVFSAGLAVPFLVIAFGIARASFYIDRYSRYLRWVSVLGGLFLIFLGVLLITNNFSLLISYGFDMLDFLRYEAIVDYL